MEEFFIPFNVPSSKNGKQWTGKRLIWSKSAQLYVKNTERYYQEYASEFMRSGNFHHSYPYKVSFKFIRGSKHRFDYVNPLQTVLDLMVKYKWILDDCADIILPVFEPYEYNKENPGVIIKFID